jgi:DNA polymerase, archaea type
MLRKGLFDIEVYSPNEFPLPDRAEHPICSNSYYDNFTNRFFSIIIDPSRAGKKVTVGDWDIYYVKDERNVIILSAKLMRFMNFDVWAGWYSDSFDVPYFLNRCNNLEMKNVLNSISPLNFVNIRGKTVSGMHVVDMIVLDKKIKKRTSYTLENLAIEEKLPVKKLEKHEDIMDIYRTDKDRFVAYNKGDVEILSEHEKKNRIIEFFENTRTFAGLNDINEALRNSVIVDTVALRKAYREGIVLPTKPDGKDSYFDEDEDEKLGGKVKFPPPGIHRNVAVVDMAKFYPVIMGLLNLSTETIVAINLKKEQIVKGDGFIYVEYEDGKYAKIRKDVKGFMPSLYQEFLNERLAVEAEIKKHEIDSPEYNFLMQKRQVVKDTSNSLPGVNGYEKFRLYNVVVYNAIINTGRKMISRTEKMVEELGYDDIYGDTDSRHVEVREEVTPEELVRIGKELSEKFSAAYVPMTEELFNLKCDTSFEIEFEKAFKTIIYIQKDDGTPAKKRYAAREIYEKGKYIDVLYVRGFDMRRSDASNFCKEIQEYVLRSLLWEKPKEEVIKYLQNKISGFREASLEDISTPKGINKPLSEYGKPNKNGKKGTIPAQIKGAIYSNTHLHTNFNIGSKIKYFFVKKMPSGFPATNIISFDDVSKLPEGIIVDYEKMIDANIKKKVERILQAAGIPWNDIEGQKSLFDF